MASTGVLHRPPALSDDREPFLEMDPTGRYGRYGDLLGVGGVKKVYRAFDLLDGVEVAWNQVLIRWLSHAPLAADGLFTELELLRSLRHPNILALRHAWKDIPNGSVNFITELCTSGDLRSYRRLHRSASLKAMKRWARQILEGIHVLHTHSPTHVVIHRDLNCSNVFINGYTGEVKIGDLGSAAVVRRGHVAHAVVGTPEFMAPEIYQEEYTEKVDVYAFGMCVLELATMEVPYKECDSLAGVFNKVAAGEKPEGLGKVMCPEVKMLIERCLAPADERPTATELLEDPIFHGVQWTAEV